MNRSEQITNLVKALCEAQKTIKIAEKDSTNPHFRSKYASFESVISASRKSLLENGLVVSQIIDATLTNGHLLKTLLMHTSGEWLESTMPILAKDLSPQAFGSALTYAKRYAMAAIVGVGTGEDDDANEAQPTIQKPPVTIEKKELANKATIQQIKLVMVLLKQMGVDEEAAKVRWKSITGKASRTEWTFDDAKKVIEAMKSYVESMSEKAPDLVPHNGGE